MTNVGMRSQQKHVKVISTVKIPQLKASRMKNVNILPIPLDACDSLYHFSGLVCALNHIMHKDLYSDR